MIKNGLVMLANILFIAFYVLGIFWLLFETLKGSITIEILLILVFLFLSNLSIWTLGSAWLNNTKTHNINNTSEEEYAH